MKKTVLAIIVIVLLFLIISYFIPVRKLNEIIVPNSYTNIIKATVLPRNWIKWNDDVKEAWQKDSSNCHFSVDSENNISTIDLPGQQFRIIQNNFLLYQLAEIKNSHRSDFSMLLTIHVGSHKGSSGLNTLLTYGRMSRLLYQIFPFMDDSVFESKTIASLKSYLENPSRFYGFPIEMKLATDSIFLTKTTLLKKTELFKKMPAIFNELDSFARTKKIANPFNKNISFKYLDHDSVSLYTGVNIDKKIQDDYLISCQELPTGQIMAVGHFEGHFSNRPELYKVMDQFLSDHQFIKSGVPFEKYLSPLPKSDSAMIKIELYYPLLNAIIPSAPNY